MSKILEIKIPDIGDFKEVAVIEVLVKPGDVIKAEDSIVTLESEKASMDVPAPSAGIVKAVKVKVGEMVAVGTVLLLLETEATQAALAPAKPATTASAAKPAAPAAAAPSEPVRTPAPAASTFAGDVQDAQVPRA
jgi:pyruvate/2-oxoglutarate dehydrogenase complex dihydrolipoamide acyltransferase (E2) component